MELLEKRVCFRNRRHYTTRMGERKATCCELRYSAMPSPPQIPGLIECQYKMNIFVMDDYSLQSTSSIGLLAVGYHVAYPQRITAGYQNFPQTPQAGIYVLETQWLIARNSHTLLILPTWNDKMRSFLSSNWNARHVRIRLPWMYSCRNSWLTLSRSKNCKYISFHYSIKFKLYHLQ